jgi:glycosyltransferase involved in cell wall biosynthesis
LTFSGSIPPVQEKDITDSAKVVYFDNDLCQTAHTAEWRNQMSIEQTKVSIVIPVYRAENTLERCLASVFAQTHSNLEVILIDDGSPDRSPEICDSYAQKDERIRVIHQSNTGVGAARNAGMSVMSGAYLFFLDADDYIVPETITVLVNRAEKTGADITIGNLRESGGRGLVRESPPYSRESILSEQQAIAQVRYELFYDPGYGVTAWNKLYRAGFLEEHGIAFENRRLLCEDRVFNTRCFIHRPRIELVNRYTYVYCIDASTITRSKIDNPVEKSLSAVEAMKDALDANQSADENEDLFTWFVFGQINQCARNFAIHSERPFKDIKAFLQQYRENDLVRRCLEEIGSGKHMEGISRTSWKRYARGLSRLLSRGAYTKASMILWLRFKVIEHR